MAIVGIGGVVAPQGVGGRFNNQCYGRVLCVFMVPDAGL